MRQALINENGDLCTENRRYVMRITGEDKEGQDQLGNFIDPESTYPVLVTTSRLLSTGVDAQTCRLIVLDRPVGSMTEFKQILGRGTRVHEETKKLYFTLMDFRGATSHFADPDFDGEPVQIYDPDDDDPMAPPDRRGGRGDPGGRDHHRPRQRHPDQRRTSRASRKVYVNGVLVTIIAERVKYLDADGKLITESLRDYSKKAVIEPLRFTRYVSPALEGRGPEAGDHRRTRSRRAADRAARRRGQSRTSIPSTSSATSPTAGRR